MILRPRLLDIKIIGLYLGHVISGLALTLLVPIVFGFMVGEPDPAFDFIIAAELAFLAGLILKCACRVDKELNWMQGMIVVALSWLAAMFLGAVPLYLSGHWGTYLDACFEAMSGFATTGLTLVHRLDHLSLTHNLWRHLSMFLGGQGVVIIALSFFVKGFSGGFKMYVGEARDERILPNVMHTSRFIWLLSLSYLVLGSVALAASGMGSGMPPGRALFHGVCLFMAAFDTGGFTPQSQSILYYHNASLEFITLIIMVLGAMNFRLHYQVLTGNRREIWRNLETVGFAISGVALYLIVAVGLLRGGIYSQADLFFRKGFYQLLSAHTGTGYQTIYAEQFLSGWPHLSVAGVIVAMMIGGAVCSTTGAIKILRIGIIFKALIQDIRRIILPERSVVVEKFHHIRDTFLEDKQVRLALLVTLAYLALYGIGALAGMFCGHPFLDALFESTSAAANVGLSCGITQSGMPALLKVVYIVQMWAGRLEFMSIFALLGFFYAWFKGR